VRPANPEQRYYDQLTKEFGTPVTILLVTWVPWLILGHYFPWLWRNFVIYIGIVLTAVVIWILHCHIWWIQHRQFIEPSQVENRREGVYLSIQLCAWIAGFGMFALLQLTGSVNSSLAMAGASILVVGILASYIHANWLKSVVRERNAIAKAKQEIGEGNSGSLPLVAEMGERPE
jgi:hypothetical protein